MGKTRRKPDEDEDDDIERAVCPLCERPIRGTPTERTLHMQNCLERVTLKRQGD